MPREYIDLSDVCYIGKFYIFGDVAIPMCNQIYYDTMLECLTFISNRSIILSKSPVEIDDTLNSKMLIHFMKDYPDRYTNEMINAVEEVINNNIRDVDELTARALSQMKESK